MADWLITLPKPNVSLINSSVRMSLVAWVITKVLCIYIVLSAWAVRPTHTKRAWLDIYIYTKQPEVAKSPLLFTINEPSPSVNPISQATSSAREGKGLSPTKAPIFDWGNAKLNLLFGVVVKEAKVEVETNLMVFCMAKSAKLEQLPRFIRLNSNAKKITNNNSQPTPMILSRLTKNKCNCRFPIPWYEDLYCILSLVKFLYYLS